VTSASLLPAVLAGLAAVVLWGLPRRATARVDALLGRPGARGPEDGLAAARPPPEPARARRPVRRLVLAPVARGASRLRQRIERARAVEREQARAVEACGVLAAELRAGRSPAQALDAAAGVACGPTSAALRSGASTAWLGGDVPAALSLPAGGPAAWVVPELLRGLAACWTVCSTTGSGLVAAVDRLAEAQRAAAAQRRAVAVELAGPRATARLLALLPLVGLLMAAGLGAAPLQFLLWTLPGRLCLVLGVALEVMGLRWTTRLANRAAG
jgi:tight adherence protein B